MLVQSDVALWYTAGQTVTLKAKVSSAPISMFMGLERRGGDGRYNDHIGITDIAAAMRHSA